MLYTARFISVFAIGLLISTAGTFFHAGKTAFFALAFTGSVLTFKDTKTIYLQQLKQSFQACSSDFKATAAKVAILGLHVLAAYGIYCALVYGGEDRLMWTCMSMLFTLPLVLDLLFLDSNFIIPPNVSSKASDLRSQLGLVNQNGECLTSDPDLDAEKLNDYSSHFNLLKMQIAEDLLRMLLFMSKQVNNHMLKPLDTFVTAPRSNHLFSMPIGFVDIYGNWRTFGPKDPDLKKGLENYFEHLVQISSSSTDQKFCAYKDLWQKDCRRLFRTLEKITELHTKILDAKYGYSTSNGNTTTRTYIKSPSFPFLKEYVLNFFKIFQNANDPWMTELKNIIDNFSSNKGLPLDYQNIKAQIRPLIEGYQILGLDQKPDKKVLNSRFKKLALTLHPDKLNPKIKHLAQEEQENIQEEAKRIFQFITNIKDALRQEEELKEILTSFFSKAVS